MDRHDTGPSVSMKLSWGILAVVVDLSMANHTFLFLPQMKNKKRNIVIMSVELPDNMLGKAGGRARAR